MSAPTTKTLFHTSGRIVGVQLLCPDCEIARKRVALRCELPNDYPDPESRPDLVYRPGPLGFLLRCDRCGFRLEMHGDRLPNAAMLNPAWVSNPCA